MFFQASLFILLLWQGYFNWNKEETGRKKIKRKDGQGAKGDVQYYQGSDMENQQPFYNLARALWIVVIQ